MPHYVYVGYPVPGMESLKKKKEFNLNFNTGWIGVCILHGHVKAGKNKSSIARLGLGLGNIGFIYAQG